MENWFKKEFGLGYMEGMRPNGFWFHFVRFNYGMYSSKLTYNVILGLYYYSHNAIYNGVWAKTGQAHKEVFNGLILIFKSYKVKGVKGGSQASKNDIWFLDGAGKGSQPPREGHYVPENERGWSNLGNWSWLIIMNFVYFSLSSLEAC